MSSPNPADDALAYAQELRLRVAASILDSGDDLKHADPKMLKVALGALDSSDRQILTIKRLAQEIQDA